MVDFLVKRLIQWIPMLLVSTVVLFVLIRMMPGDVVDVLAGSDASADVVAAIREQYGLDQPLTHQYLAWLWQFLQGNFGESLIYHRDIGSLIAARLPYSLVLALSALALSVAIGIPAGVWAARHKSKVPDFIVSAASASAIAMPGFWFGMLCILVFSVHLNWLPPGGSGRGFANPLAFLANLILPSATLALNGVAILARFTRGAVLEVIGADHVRTAIAKGLSARKIMRRHILRNAWVPITTMGGMLFGRMLASAVIIETVFAWPGIGRLLVQSISNRDYGVVQAILVMMVFFFLFLNLVVDLAYGLLDPRMRAGSDK